MTASLPTREVWIEIQTGLDLHLPLYVTSYAGSVD